MHRQTMLPQNSNLPHSLIHSASTLHCQTLPLLSYSNSLYCPLKSLTAVYQEILDLISYSRTSSLTTVCQVFQMVTWSSNQSLHKWGSEPQYHKHNLSSSQPNSSRKSSTDNFRYNTGKPSSFSFRVNWLLKLSLMQKKFSLKAQILQNVTEIRNSKKLY